MKTRVVPQTAIEVLPEGIAGRHLSRIQLSDPSDNVEMIQNWLQEKEPQTQQAYFNDVAEFIRTVNHKPLNLVVIEDLYAFQRHLIDRGLSYSSQRRKLMAVKSLLKFGFRIGALAVNVGQEFKLKKQPKTLAQRILSESDTLKMIHGFKGSTRDSLILQILYAAGLRASELCALKWRDVAVRLDEKAVLAITGKGGKTRHVGISPELWHRIEYTRQGALDSAPIFPSRTGAHLTRSQVNRIVSSAKDQAGLARNVSPHWLRHAHASHALAKGAPVKLVKETLGHSSLETTDQYLHVSPEASSGDYLAI